MKRVLRISGRLLGGLLTIALVCALTATALTMAAASLVEARPGEWSVPLRIGTADFGVHLDAGVASLLRVAMHPLVLRSIDGRSITTRFGMLRFTRVDRDRLAIECHRCRLRWSAVGSAGLEVDVVRIIVARQEDAWRGSIEVGAVDPLVGRFVGRIVGSVDDADGDRMTLSIRFDPAPIARWYRFFEADVPEVQVARIDGRASLAIAWRMPSMKVEVDPVVEGFAVSGLGTERLAGRLPDVSCGGSVGRRAIDGRADFGRWLPLAVIAAEDQRYYQHPGYDLDELASSLSRNQQASRIERGASTLPQQLAKLLYVGSERSMSRKLRELLYAVEMERTLGKARMLQLYLAVAPWGEGVCGAQAAARHYFDRPVTSLSGAQAVWLAAMLHGPDGEAARWDASGTIDTARATRIASGLRPVAPKTRARIAEDLRAMAPRASRPVRLASDADASNGPAAASTATTRLASLASAPAGRRATARSAYRPLPAAGS